MPVPAIALFVVGILAIAFFQFGGPGSRPASAMCTNVPADTRKLRTEQHPRERHAACIH